MTDEFKTLKFPDTEDGQRQKIAAMSEASAKGWKLVSETITSESVDLGDSARKAACLCFLCGPFCTPFLMNPTKKNGCINLTFSRSSADRESAEAEEAASIKLELERQAQYQMAQEKALQADRIRADYQSLMNSYMESENPPYVSSNLIKALKKYLREDRKPFGGIPCIRKCRRHNNSIVIVDDEDQVLATYSLSMLSKLDEA